MANFYVTRQILKNSNGWPVRSHIGLKFLLSSNFILRKMQTVPQKLVC